VPTARLGDRGLFPDLEAVAYLNHAAISPPSLPVREAVRGWLDSYARRGAGALFGWIEQRERLRGTLAALIGARAEDVGLITNTSQGVVDVAVCYPWRAGDRVVVFQGDFPANVVPWVRAAEAHGLELIELPLDPFARSDEEGLASLRAALERGVRMVATSAVGFQTGLRMPLSAMGALCHAHGAELFVDAIHAAGVVPIADLAPHVDYLACGSYKWLMGVEGAGFLYVHPTRIGALRPLVASWLSVEDGLGFLMLGAGHLRYDRPVRRRADFVEGGTSNGTSFAALEASLGLLLEVGIDAIHAHVNAYHDRLEPELSARGFQSARPREPERRGGALCLRPPAGVDVVALHADLGRTGIACAIPDGMLRLAPQWPNDIAEVPRVVDAIDGALRRLGASSAAK
jgi:selenocysteine lyase/cysteine desulfurase